MEKLVEDRRRVSYSGLLDSAIRSANKLISSRDSQTKILANQVLLDLMLLRREIPTRREFDTKPVQARKANGVSNKIGDQI
jgi:hypothetical protein